MAADDGEPTQTEAPVERVRLPSSAGTVTAAVHRPADLVGPAALLLPGAGGDLDGSGLVSLARVLARCGCPVVRANLPYREQGRRFPPRAEAAVDDARRLRAAAAQLLDVDAWIVGGKSYGGRVLSMAHADGLDARGLIFYGYPLHPPGRPDEPRVAHWERIRAGCLFLQGTRDEFCDLDRLRASLVRLGGTATVEVVDGGDHSLRVTRRASPDGVARSEDQVIETLAGSVARWVASLGG